MEAGGAAFGGDGGVETGAAIVAGMMEERQKRGNQFLGCRRIWTGPLA
jgi:hypothetical protein